MRTPHKTLVLLCIFAGTGISCEIESPQFCSHDSISLGPEQTTEQRDWKHPVQRRRVLEGVSGPTQPHCDGVVHPVRC